MKNRLLIESILYSENIKERMHPNVEKDLIDNTTSFGDNPCFPILHDTNFISKVVSDRFVEVVERCRRAFDVDEINNQEIKMSLLPIINEILKIESQHKEALIELAINMVKEEFDIVDEIDFNVDLNHKIEMVNNSVSDDENEIEIDYEDHDEMEYVSDSINKRRFINGMIQGAAKKVNHMFHMVDDELTKLNPRLPNYYNKLMSATDYLYFLMADLGTSTNGGSCDVEYSEKNCINAKAMVFPVLLHELVKGCMEILSVNGLPENPNIAKYVINKTDKINYELWGLRGGPALWGKFCSMIPVSDINLKYHVYTDLVSLSPKEFFSCMREIMGGTKRGSEIINELLESIKREMKEDEYNQSIGDDYFDIGDLF